MTQLSVVILPRNEWKSVLAEFGDGKIVPRYQFVMCNDSDERFLWHVVIHGHHTETGQLTNSGFLRNQAGVVVAGVDGIPTF